MKRIFTANSNLQQSVDWHNNWLILLCLLEHLPKPSTVIYDIGSGYGEYTWWMTALGYEVHLFDLSVTEFLLTAYKKRRTEMAPRFSSTIQLLFCFSFILRKYELISSASPDKRLSSFE